MAMDMDNDAIKARASEAATLLKRRLAGKPAAMAATVLLVERTAMEIINGITALTVCGLIEDKDSPDVAELTALCVAGFFNTANSEAARRAKEAEGGAHGR